MAPLPVITDVYRVALRWQPPAGLPPAVNVMHFRSPSSSAAALNTALDANVSTSMWQQAPNSVGIYEVDTTPLDGSGLTSVFTTGLPAKWKGAVGTSELVPQVAVILKINSGFRGRSHRGRLFLPWACEGSISAGQYASTSQTAQQTAWNTFLTGMVGAGHHLCVASYKYASSVDSTGVLVKTLLATQRRRQPRK